MHLPSPTVGWMLRGTTAIQITAPTIPGSNPTDRPAPRLGLPISPGRAPNVSYGVGLGLEGRREGLQGWDRVPIIPSLPGGPRDPTTTRQREEADHDYSGRSQSHTGPGQCGRAASRPWATETQKQVQPILAWKWPQGAAGVVPGAADYDRFQVCLVPSVPNNPRGLEPTSVSREHLTIQT